MRLSRRITQRSLSGRWVRGVLCILCAGLLAVVPAQAQEQPLDEARAAYQAADFDRAIALFAEVAKNSRAAVPARREALQYLGRAYVAKDLLDEARASIQALLELEPPLYEPNPNAESPPYMRLYYEVRKDFTGSYEVERSDPGLQTLAIMDFANSSVDEKARFEPLEQGFPSMMINYLNGATDLKVIERQRIQWLLKELELQRQPGLVDPSTAVRTGKLLGAQAVIFGSYTVQGERMWLSARVVKVETGEILLAEQIFGERETFFELIEDLSGQVTAAINEKLDDDVRMEQGAIDARRDTQSLEAVLAYSQGLALLERDRFEAAYEKFLEALTYDPGYRQARLRAESLRPMLLAGGGVDLPALPSSSEGS